MIRPDYSRQSVNPNECQYLDMLAYCLNNGREKSDRTGVGTISVTGASRRYDLGAGFPLLTTKKMFWKGIVAELLWFLSGDTNANTLRRQGVFFWDEWARADGSLGPIYGQQWRRFGTGGMDSIFEFGEYWPKGEDQIANLLSNLKANPLSRRHVVTTWNPAEIDDMALPPCHGIATQFVCEPLTLGERADIYGRHRDWASSMVGAATQEFKHKTMDRWGAPRYRLSCVMHQRSGDMFLGVPFNIASYALLTHMVAAECNMVPGDFVHTIGDAHIYLNHVAQVKEQLSRAPYEAPTVELNLFEPRVLKVESKDIMLKNYQHHPAIKAPVAV